MRGILVLLSLAAALWFFAGCRQEPLHPTPRTLAQEKTALARSILVSMYSHRDGLRDRSAHDAVAEARSVAAEFYAMESSE